MIKTSIDVLLADDHLLVRSGIKAIIEREGKEKDGEEIKVVGEAANGYEVLELATKISPDLYVIDIAMPLLNGLETARSLMENDPQNRVIMLSMHDDKSYVEKAMKYNVRGYIMKESAPEEIIQAIREVYKGNFFLSPGISKYIVQGFRQPVTSPKKEEKSAELTGRETGILQLVAEGFTNKEIASKLKLSSNTVHVHRKNIMKKLNIHNRAALIRYALKTGITKL